MLATNLLPCYCLSTFVCCNISQGKISFNFSSQVELLKDAEGCIAVHDLAVMHQAQVTELEKDPDGWIVPYVLQKTALVWSASRQAQTQHQNWWHDISCHQTRNEFINVRVLTTKPQARMPVQPHPLTHLPIHKQKQVTIWYGHTEARTSEIRVLSSFIDVESTFSFSHPLPCLFSPLWAY